MKPVFSNTHSYALMSSNRLSRMAPAPAIYNAAVQAVVRRAGGLPLYVRHVIHDLVSGDFHVEELERRLPLGLNAYYDSLLQRLALGELQALLTPLIVTLACAVAPLEEETLLLLLVRRKVLQQGDDYDRALLRRGLEALGSMIHRTVVPSGGHGYEPYHLSFREHIRTDEAGLIGRENAKARDSLCTLTQDWSSIPRGHPARHYVLRYGPQTLLQVGRCENVVGLLTDLFFLEAKAEAGLVFELAGDFGAALKAIAGQRSASTNSAAVRGSAATRPPLSGAAPRGLVPVFVESGLVV